MHINIRVAGLVRCSEPNRRLEKALTELNLRQAPVLDSA